MPKATVERESARGRIHAGITAARKCAPEKKVTAVEETKPLAEANRAPPVTLGFGNDEEDF